MSSDFQCVAAPAESFSAFFELNPEQLEARGARRMTVDQNPGVPCRVSLEDAALGEQVILLPFKYHDVDSPYQASGPVFVRETATQARHLVNELPQMLKHRLLSVRAYDGGNDMISADVVPGNNLAAAIRDLLADPGVAYLHLHNARQGCYLCAVARA